MSLQKPCIKTYTMTIKSEFKMLLEVISLVIVLLFTYIFFYFQWSYRYWRKRNVYTPDPSFPFGNIKDTILGKVSLGIKVAEFYKMIKKENHRYGGFYFLYQPNFIPVDIKLVQHILTIDFQHFTDHVMKMSEETDPLSGNLFNLTGAKWKALRVKLTPLFSSGKLKMMFETLQDCTKNFHYVVNEMIERNEPFDINDLFARYTTDVIGSLAFGIECNSLKNEYSEFREKGKRFIDAGSREVLINTLTILNPKFLDYLRLKTAKDDVEEFFIRIVKETIEYREENNVERKDFMQLLMKLRNEKLKVESSIDKNQSKDEVEFLQDGLTMNEITAQSFLFFIAGFETSSTTLNFLMLELVQNPEIQNKLREEIENVLKSHDGKVTYEAVQEMTYLDNCLNETLRKYPPLAFIPRVCTKDYKIPGSDVIIEKGTAVHIPAYGIHHDPDFYPNPEKFDPDRFLKENRSKIPSHAFIPFGEGPRICIGLRLGVLQTKVGLIALLRNYKFTLNKKTKIPVEFNSKTLTLLAKNGVWVNAHF